MVPNAGIEDSQIRHTGVRDPAASRTGPLQRFVVDQDRDAISTEHGIELNAPASQACRNSQP
jgi:hypothetical protein